MDQWRDQGVAGPTKQDYVFGVIAWLLIAPVAVAVVAAAVYEAATTVARHMGW